MSRKQTFYECPECHRYISYLQSRCDCGYRFTGKEKKYRSCPKCGSFYPSPRLFCDCGHFLPFDKEEITPDDVESAYQSGYLSGVAQERDRTEKEWAQFFKDVQLKDTITGQPIRTREDFARWKAAFEAEKARREKVKNRYLVEADDGFSVSVPEDKLGSWVNAQDGQPAPLNTAEQRLKDRIMKRIYGIEEEGPTDEKAR